MAKSSKPYFLTKQNKLYSWNSCPTDLLQTHGCPINHPSATRNLATTCTIKSTWTHPIHSSNHCLITKWHIFCGSFRNNQTWKQEIYINTHEMCRSPCPSLPPFYFLFFFILFCSNCSSYPAIKQKFPNRRGKNKNKNTVTALQVSPT